MKKLLVLMVVLVTQLCNSQENPAIISGYIINVQSGKSIENAHIVNNSSKKGTISKRDGSFEIEAYIGDSLQISCISYAYYSTELKLSNDKLLIIKLNPLSIKLNEIVVKPKTWQQFKLEFVQTEWSAEQSAEIKIHGVKQYKGPLLNPAPTLATAIKSPISFTHYLLNKKSRQKRKTNRYKRIIQKSYYSEN